MGKVLVFLLRIFSGGLLVVGCHFILFFHVCLCVLGFWAAGGLVDPFLFLLFFGINCH